MNATVTEFTILWKPSSMKVCYLDLHLISHYDSFHLCRKPRMPYMIWKKSRRNGVSDRPLKFPGIQRKKTPKQTDQNKPTIRSIFWVVLLFSQVFKRNFLVKHNQTLRVWWHWGIKWMRICTVNIREEETTELFRLKASRPDCFYLSVCLLWFMGTPLSGRK